MKTSRHIFFSSASCGNEWVEVAAVQRAYLGRARRAAHGAVGLRGKGGQRGGVLDVTLGLGWGGREGLGKRAGIYGAAAPGGCGGRRSDSFSFLLHACPCALCVWCVCVVCMNVSAAELQSHMRPIMIARGSRGPKATTQASVQGQPRPSSACKQHCKDFPVAAPARVGPP